MFGFLMNKAVICFGHGIGAGGKIVAHPVPKSLELSKPYSRLKKGGGNPGSRYNRMRSAAGRRAAGGR